VTAVPRRPCDASIAGRAGLRARWRRFVRDARGQSFAEWAVSAGILASLGLAISVALNQGMRVIVRGLAEAVKTIAP
jgi:hypothetical protein